MGIRASNLAFLAGFDEKMKGHYTRVKPFEWQDWSALWELRSHQLAEDGIVVAALPSQPDLSSPYEQDYHRIDHVYLTGAGGFWIAWQSETPVGHVGGQDLGGVVELRHMYVRPDRRRQGVGTRLVRTLIEHCVARGVKAIELWTTESGPGHVLYANLGFRIVGRPGEEFRDAPVSAEEVRMRLDLKGGYIMGLSPKDRVIAQIEHRETDHIPYTLGFEGNVAERLDAYYGSDEWRDLVDSAIVRVPVPEMVVDETAGQYYTDRYGSTWQVDRRPFHLVEPALKQPSLAGYVFPDVDAIFGDAWKNKACEFIEQNRDHFMVASFGFGLFERTWALRGFDGALMDAAAEPDFYDELVEQVTNHQMAIVEHLLELPLDGIMFSDDWGYQQGVLLGPDRWRKLLKPRLARMYARVHEAGKVVLSHCCGSIADIMRDVIEIGLYVLESVQPEARDMNPYRLKERYGEAITFWGGLGSQSTIPFGTPGEIRDEVSRLCRKMGRNGGYILAPAKSLQPETPTENAAAVVEAFLHQAGVSFPSATDLRPPSDTATIRDPG